MVQDGANRVDGDVTPETAPINGLSIIYGAVGLLGLVVLTVIAIGLSVDGSDWARFVLLALMCGAGLVIFRRLRL